MKKTFFGFWLLLALGLTTAVFSSCSKDEKEEPEINNNDNNNNGNNNCGNNNGNNNGGNNSNNQTAGIVGTWKYSQAFTKVYGQTIEATNPAHYQEVTFTADGKFTTTGWGETSGTYKTNGSALSTTATFNGVTQTLEAGATFMQNGALVLIKSYTYEVEDNTLKMITEQEVTNMGMTMPSTSWVVYVK